MVSFKINEKIYNVPVVVSVGNWNKCREVLFKKYKLQKEEQCHHGGLCEWYEEKGWALNSIWLPEFNYEYPTHIGVLVHEIEHACNNIFNLMSIPVLDNQSNHAYIYLKEYFTIAILTKLKRFKNE